MKTSKKENKMTNEQTQRITYLDRLRTVLNNRNKFSDSNSSRKPLYQISREGIYLEAIRKIRGQ